MCTHVNLCMCLTAKVCVDLGTYFYNYTVYVVGAFRNGELCRITKFSQEVVKNGR